MSDAQEALELLKKQRSDNEELKKSVNELMEADTAGKIAEIKEKQAILVAGFFLGPFGCTGVLGTCVADLV